MSDKTPLASEPTTNKSTKSDQLDELVEIQHASLAKVFRVSQPETSAPAVPTVSRSSSSQDDHRAKPTIEFLGQGKSLRLHHGVIHSPLVYVAQGSVPRVFVTDRARAWLAFYDVNDAASSDVDASLIELQLPVAWESRPKFDLPYWPTYRGADPSQRAYYLNWLLSGKNDPNVPLGYVFIYFYGLERRVLEDRQDHRAIAEEVLRLMGIYCGSRSFQRYASSFLWLTIVLGLERGQIPAEFIEQAATATAHWSEENLALWLSCCLALQMPLSARGALRIAQHDPRTPRSVIIKRHPEMFERLFEKRYADRFGSGLLPRAAKRNRKLTYIAASGSLARYRTGNSWLATKQISNALGLSSQFEPLIETWNSVIDDLRQYDRAHQKSDGRELTGEMYEALPADLRTEDHPDIDRWYAVMAQNITEDGWTLIPISQLAELKGIDRRSRLTKTQCSQILGTIDAMGMAAEPDARLSNQNYGWDDVVSVFPREDDHADDFGSYQAAATLLRLGLTIAMADGHVDDVELARLSKHLESQFNLTEAQSIRLEHLRYILRRFEFDAASVYRSLKRSLTEPQRRTVGEFLVAIAAADQEVTPAERQALVRAYSALGLRSSELDKLVPPASVAAADQPLSETSLETSAIGSESVFLDADRINQIMAETEQVSTFLRQALQADEDFEERSVASTNADGPTVLTAPADCVDAKTSGPDAPSLATVSAGLASRYEPFLTTVLAQEQWSRAELDGIARQQGVMLNGALEAINEWSLEQFGDLLLQEDGGNISVQTSLMGTAGTAA